MDDRQARTLKEGKMQPIDPTEATLCLFGAFFLGVVCAAVAEAWQEARRLNRIRKITERVCWSSTARPWSDWKRD